jgi:hypothetical protein
VRLFRHYGAASKVSVMPGITAQAAVLLPFGHKIARMR